MKVNKMYVRDKKTGKLVETNVIHGKSAYEQYKIGGGTLTEEEFIVKLNHMADVSDIEVAKEELTKEITDLADEVDGYTREVQSLNINEGVYFDNTDIATSTGANKTSSGKCASDFIEVDNTRTIYYINKTPNVNAYIRFFEYDENKTFIKYTVLYAKNLSTSSSTLKELALQPTTKYIRVAYFEATKDTVKIAIYYADSTSTLEFEEYASGKVIKADDVLNKSSKAPISNYAVATIFDRQNENMPIFVGNKLAESYWKNTEYDSTDYSYNKIDGFYTNIDKGVRAKINGVVVDIPSGYSAYKIRYSLVADMSDYVELSIGAVSTYEILNLIPNRTYYYQILANDVVLKEDTINTKGARRLCRIEGVKNVRDLGCIETVDGRKIRSGLIFRGANLDSITADGKNTFLNELNIKAEIDFRVNEIVNGSDSDDIVDVDNLDSYTSGQTFPTTQVSYKLMNSASFKTMSASAKNGYLVLVLKQILDNLKNGKATYCHCAGGADRTGVVSATLEGLMGVSENDINKDYELTTFEHGGLKARDTVDSYDFKGGMAYIKSLDGATYRDKWNTYCINGGMTQEEIDELRAILLV